MFCHLISVGPVVRSSGGCRHFCDGRSCSTALLGATGHQEWRSSHRLDSRVYRIHHPTVLTWRCIFFYFLSPPKPQTMRVITIMVTFFILLSIALSCLVSGSMGSTRIDYQGVFSRRRETIVFQFVNHRKTAAVLVLCGNVEHKEAQDNDYHHTHTQRI